MTTRTLREVAQEVLTLSPLMTGREKISTKDIVGKTLTIIAFDFVNSDDGKQYPVLNFAELPNNFYSGGTLLAKICNAWVEEMGSIEAANLELEGIMGVQIRMGETRTKSGNNLVTVEVL